MSSLDRLTNSPVLFAPMVGLSHFAVRQALSEWLPENTQALWPTEMLSSRRLSSQVEGQTPEVIFADRANGLCPQLLGNEESFIRDSIYKLEDWGARAIDINMGCPVKKALQHNYGVALMGDVDYAAKITGIAVKYATVPVSVKLRAGLQNDTEFLLRFARALENAGASWLTLHPRTASQKRRGNADWAQIKLLKEHLSIPIIGNGDIQCGEDAREILRSTDCDRVMIGRALTSKPWLLSELRPEAKASYALPNSPQEAASYYGKFLLRVLEISKDCYTVGQTLRKLNFLIYHGCVWLEFGHALHTDVRGTRTLEDTKAAIENFFSKPRRIFERTELRH